jgi:hypothetical protein
MEILDERGAARADAKRILVIGNSTTLRGRQDGVPLFGKLVEFPAFAAIKFLVMNCCGIGSGGLRCPLGHCLVP